MGGVCVWRVRWCLYDGLPENTAWDGTQVETPVSEVGSAHAGAILNSSPALTLSARLCSRRFVTNARFRIKEETSKVCHLSLPFPTTCGLPKTLPRRQCAAVKQRDTTHCRSQSLTFSGPDLTPCADFASGGAASPRLLCRSSSASVTDARHLLIQDAS